MKIKCLRFECVCGKLASIQVFYNNSGTIKYARGRHYTGQVNGKPKFEYHQLSLEYIQRKLGRIPNAKTEIGQIDHKSDIDPKKTKLDVNWSWGWELNPYITALQAVA